MKNIFLILVIALSFVACNNETPPKAIELTGGTSTSQTLYANETAISEAIKFTASEKWSASVSPVAKASNVDWLELSQYSGTAGSFALNLTLGENKTGVDRKAEVRIVSGGETITIAIVQKSTNKPSNPDDPQPSMRYVKKITQRSSRIDLEMMFEYDKDMRISKILSESIIKNEGDERPIAGAVEFTYDGNKIHIQPSLSAGTSIIDGTIDFTLDNHGRASQMVQIGTGAILTDSAVVNPSPSLFAFLSLEKSISKAQISYKSIITRNYTYDANGYALGMTLTEESDPADIIIPEFRTYGATWSDGNLSKVEWKHASGFSPYDMITYSSTEKNACNLDLSAIFAATESYSMFYGGWGMFGYFGKSSRLLPATAMSYYNYGSEVKSEGYEYTYTFDSQGYVSTCVATGKGERGTYPTTTITIEYVK